MGRIGLTQGRLVAVEESTFIVQEWLGGKFVMSFALALKAPAGVGECAKSGNVWNCLE